MKLNKTDFCGSSTLNPVYIPHKSKGAVLSQERYVSLDSTASTPPLAVVAAAVAEFSTVYSSAHRGTGFKSQLTTHLIEQSRRMVKDFVGLSEEDAQDFTVIYGKNTTEVLNILAHQINVLSKDRPKVVTSLLEHHSNDLPWRNRLSDPANDLLRIPSAEDGTLDLAAFKSMMAEHGDSVALVTVTGASNTTGWVTDAKSVSEVAKSHGSVMVLDCAQLAPHRPIHMSANKLDAVTFCGHKMYAPYGTACLVVRTKLVTHGTQDHVPLIAGGGTIRTVLEDAGNVWYEQEPHASEGGSPNSVGIIALMSAMKVFNSLGWEAIVEHEKSLAKLALEGIAALNAGADLDRNSKADLTKLANRKKIRVYGGQDTSDEELNGRLGVISFDIEGVYHATIGAILGHEFGIGIRTGCFCAHPYVLKLINMSKEDQLKMAEGFADSDSDRRPGFCRASFGLYNDANDVMLFIRGLQRIADGEELLKYEVSSDHGMVVNPVEIRKTSQKIEQPWNGDSFEAAFSLEALQSKVLKSSTGKAMQEPSLAKPTKKRLKFCFGL